MRHHGYTGKWGYQRLLAVAAGAGDSPIPLMWEGRANTVRDAANFLGETVGRVRNAGARDNYGAGRQQLLCPRPGRGLPESGRMFLDHHPSAQ